MTDSIVERLKGKIGSAVMLTTGSAIDSTGTSYRSLEMSDISLTTGSVINAQNGDYIKVTNSYFANNTASDIFSQSTKVDILAGTIFQGPINDTNGYATVKPFPFLYAVKSAVNVD